MGQISILVNNNPYQIACDDSEEEHVRKLASFLDKQVQSLRKSVGQVDEARLLVMAGLTVCDELANSYSQIDEMTIESEGAIPAITAQHLCDQMEKFAQRLEDFASTLEKTA